MSIRLPVVRRTNHRKFADQYLLHGNASRAAREAGAGEKCAGQTAAKWLKRPDVIAYIEAKRQKILAKEEETTEELQARVMEELKILAFANIGDLIRIDENGRPQVDFSNAPPHVLRAIQSVKSKSRDIRDAKGRVVATEHESSFALTDKLRGIELLGKHLGMFKPDEQRVVIDVADRLLAGRRRVQALEHHRGEES